MSSSDLSKHLKNNPTAVKLGLGLLLFSQVLIKDLKYCSEKADFIAYQSQRKCVIRTY